MRTGNHLSSLLTVALAALVTSCIDIPQETHTSYETIKLEKHTISAPISWSASIVGKNDVTITPQISGQLMKVCVIEGETVTKGQTLFVIDDRQAKLVYQAAQADLQAAIAQLNTARLEFESNRNLFDKKIISSYLLNTSENAFHSAEAAVAQAEAAVQNAKVNLEFCTITSPVNGLVGVIPNNPGDQVSPMTTLTKVSGNTEMQAKFSITENDLQEIRRNRGDLADARETLPDVTLVLKDGTVYQHKGRCESISGVVDQQTGSVACRATFPNPEGYLYSGMQGTAMMFFDYEDVIKAPITSLVRMQDKALVYKVVDNCAVSTIVEFIEVGNGKDIVLTSGVKAGDVIVAVGASNVYDGQQVIFPEEK